MRRALRIATCAGFVWLLVCNGAVVAQSREEPGPPQGLAAPPPPPSAPVRVVIVRSPDHVASARDSERASRFLSEADLKAQLRAAQAAEGQITAAWVAAGLSLLGTLFLAATFWDTRRTSRRQLRAYLDFDDITLTSMGEDGDASDWWEARFRVRNFGETPAFGVTIDARSKRAWAADVQVIDDRKPPQPIGGISRGDDFAYRVGIYISQDDKVRIANDDTAIWFEAEITYRDAFGSLRKTTAIWEVTAEPGLSMREGSHVMT